MISVPSFMNGVDFFESTLLEDVPVGGTQIFLPSEDKKKLPSYPFPLTIGNSPSDIMVLCTADALSAGVPNGRIAINSTYFNSSGISESIPQGSKVICSPTFKYLADIHSFLTTLAKEYIPFYKLLPLFFGTPLSSSYGIPSSFLFPDPFLVSYHTGGDLEFAVDINLGYGLVNNRVVCLDEVVTLDVDNMFDSLPVGASKAVLIYINEFSQVAAIGGVSSLGTPDPPETPENTIPLASFTINSSGFNEEEPVDERPII